MGSIVQGVFPGKDKRLYSKAPGLSQELHRSSYSVGAGVTSEGELTKAYC
jgi:hypothetical protein